MGRRRHPKPAGAQQEAPEAPPNRLRSGGTFVDPVDLDSHYQTCVNTINGLQLPTPDEMPDPDLQTYIRCSLLAYHSQIVHPIALHVHEHCSYLLKRMGELEALVHASELLKGAEHSGRTRQQKDGAKPSISTLPPILGQEHPMPSTYQLRDVAAKVSRLEIQLHRLITGNQRIHDLQDVGTTNSQLSQVTDACTPSHLLDVALSTSHGVPSEIAIPAAQRVAALRRKCPTEGPRTRTSSICSTSHPGTPRSAVQEGAEADRLCIGVGTQSPSNPLTYFLTLPKHCMMCGREAYTLGNPPPVAAAVCSCCSMRFPPPVARWMGQP